MKKVGMEKTVWNIEKMLIISKKNGKNTCIQRWNGEGNIKRRIKQRDLMLKINSDPINKLRMIENKIFNVFNKIIQANEYITIETFLKYKSKFGTHIETVFSSLEHAVEKYQDYPKRIKI